MQDYLAINGIKSFYQSSAKRHYTVWKNRIRSNLLKQKGSRIPYLYSASCRIECDLLPVNRAI